MEVRIIKTKRRTVSLRITPAGDVEVRGPLWMTQKYAQELIREKADWIRNGQIKVLARSKNIRNFIAGDIFYYLGQGYGLVISEDYFSGVRLKDSSIEISKHKQQSAKRLLTEWYTKEAKSVLAPLLASRSKELHLVYSRMRITSARSRWGSCTSGGTISFSWKLIQAPLWVVDYVVVHELVHTIHHNHSREFWRVVQSIVPKALEARRVLKGMSTDW